MIGDVVGGADEIVERKDQRPMPRMDDPRGNRKILVTVRLAGPEVAGAAHEKLTSHWFARCAREQAPHIGEYAGKTNAFAGCIAMQPTSVASRWRGRRRR